MEKVRKKIVCFFLASFLIISNFTILKAEALPDVMSGSTTLADNIMTYYALSGSAVANTEWINELYSSYGSSFGTIEQLADQGYLVMNDAGFWEPVQQLGEMIQQAPAYSSLGLNEMFNVSAEEAATGGGLAAATGGSILAGSLGGVASTGVVPILGGVTASYWGGIALGTLIAHKIGLYGENITQGDLMTNTDLNNFKIAGGSFAGWVSLNVSGRPRTMVYVPSDLTYAYIVEKRNIYGYCETNTFFNRFRLNMATGAQSNIQNNLEFQGNKQQVHAITNGSYNYVDGYFCRSSFQTENDFLNACKNGFKNEINSPDMIGENGNLSGYKDGDQYTVPDMKPQIDPGQQAGKPLTLQDWLNFANSVSNNNNQTDPSDLNKTLFDNLLDAIKAAMPENNPNPGPDPWSPPVVDPVPDPSYPDPVPDQPTSENPNESENPQETEPLNPIDTGRPWMLPDLTKKFPFCIPWDIKDCFTLLKSNIRQAPHITWRFNPPNTPIDYTFNLDLSDFEPVAVLLRTLELIAFIAGLAFATRYLIGAS